MKTKLLVGTLALSMAHLNAQDSTTTTHNPLTISGYLEVYYSYDLSNPASHERPPFVYSFNRHNEVNLNIGFIKANYSNDKVRGNFALMAGTYAQYNLAGEQGLLKNVFEANAGVKLSNKHNLWVDAGVMPSHIGFESAVGKDCWNLTRSLLADNTPYYESGVKLGYTSNNQKWYLAAMYLNGWQRIQRIPGNQTPAFGTQLTLKPNSNITLNWSTFVGNEQPDSLKAWRYFNNFYGQFQLSEKFGVIAGVDVGLQQMKTDTNAYNNWYTPILILQYKPGIKTRIAARAEYYSDPSGVIIATGTPNGFQTMGFSLNFDYLPLENVMFRVEARTWNSKDQIFTLNQKASNMNYFFTGSLAISF
ncbi:MAG: porin [Bacteroidia bacterium]|nr:porin [Bacteroidia bacterium]